VNVSAVSTVEYSGATSRLEEVSADILFVPIFQDEDRGDLSALNDATGGELERAMAAGEFRGRAYEVFVSPIIVREFMDIWVVLFVGL